ncbi:hypothetical protein EE612_000412, partial [Oryza sativa]
CIIINR